MTSKPENIEAENIEAGDVGAEDIDSKNIGSKNINAVPKDPTTADAVSSNNGSQHTKWWILALVGVAIAAFGSAWLIFHRPAATPEPATVPVPANSDVTDGETIPDAPDAPDAEAIAQQEAEARAEFEAKMAIVDGVVQGTDRATLVGDSPTKGPSDATVVLMKFSDFECPFCAVAASDMKTFTDNHPDDVLYVYKHFPLVSIHDEALPAAKAAWAAQQQGQFWLYHDGLFAYQKRLGEDYYVELAEQIGLDVEQFNRDRNSPEAEAAVTQEAELARALELGGTPSFLMTNFTESFLLPGGAPQELYDEAVARLEAAAE